MARLAWVLVMLFLLVAGLLAYNSVSGLAVLSTPRETSFSYEVHFCSNEDCLLVIKQLFINSTSIDCAFYNFNDALAVAAPEKIRVVSDNGFKGNFSFLKKDGNGGLMHNKFCIIDKKLVLTGSFNPTSSRIDRNNLVVIRSLIIAENYDDEFEELWNGAYGKGGPVSHPEILMNNTLVENYFCPEDDCADRVIQKLMSANHSILFMAYSFTHDGIADSLVLKKYAGLDVRGVIDSSSDKEVFSYFKEQGIDVKLDQTKGLMHHKVFIIDNETVITGSFNPTYNADRNNDENIIIVHDRNFANEFLEEFDFVYSR